MGDAEEHSFEVTGKVGLWESSKPDSGWHYLAIKGQTAMESLLQKDPGINVVYSINEPSGFGGANALKAAGKDPKDFILVSVDGGCDAIKRGIKTGVIDATSQQYPQNMAAQGVKTIAEAARGGKKPSGYTDTGVNLISADPAKGVTSKDAAYGTANCWG